jgi:hypothetical protein
MRNPLSPTLMTRLTARDESFMNETFTITDVVRIPQGGGTSAPQETTRTTVGYVWSASGDEAGADQIKAMGRHRAAIPKDVPISATAKITQQSTGKVYQVVYAFPLTGYSTSRIVGLEDA